MNSTPTGFNVCFFNVICGIQSRDSNIFLLDSLTYTTHHNWRKGIVNKAIYFNCYERANGGGRKNRTHNCTESV